MVEHVEQAGEGIGREMDMAQRAVRCAEWFAQGQRDSFKAGKQARQIGRRRTRRWLRSAGCAAPVSWSRCVAGEAHQGRQPACQSSAVPPRRPCCVGQRYRPRGDWRGTAQAYPAPRRGSTLERNRSAIGLLCSPEDARCRITERQALGDDMRRRSLTGNRAHTQRKVMEFYSTGERVATWGKSALFRGSLPGSTVPLLPGVGLVVAGGTAG